MLGWSDPERRDSDCKIRQLHQQFCLLCTWKIILKNSDLDVVYPDMELLVNGNSSAKKYGGAIYNAGDLTGTIKNANFTSNSAPEVSVNQLFQRACSNLWCPMPRPGFRTLRTENSAGWSNLHRRCHVQHGIVDVASYIGDVLVQLCHQHCMSAKHKHCEHHSLTKELPLPFS